MPSPENGPQHPSEQARSWLHAAAAPGRSWLRLAATCQTLETAFTIVQWAALAWVAQEVLAGRAHPGWPALGALLAAGLLAALATASAARFQAAGRQRISRVIRQRLVAGSFFRIDNLTALRELTLRRKALHTQRKLHESGDLGGLSVPALSTETVLVSVLRGDEAQALVRRGVHLADRLRGKLVVLQISEPGAGLQLDASRGHQEAVRALELARALGAEVHTLIAYSNLADTLVGFATDVGASQIVLGERTNSWLRDLFGGSIVRDVLRRTRDVDVHIVRRAER